MVIRYATKEDITKIEKMIQQLDKKIDLLLDELEFLEAEEINELIEKIKQGKEKTYSLEEVLEELDSE